MGKTGTIIVAAGSGTRMNTAIPKQFLMLGEAPVLVHTVRRFFSALPDTDMVVVVSGDRVEYWRQMSRQYDLPSHKVAVGGATRFDSVAGGLAALDSSCSIVGVHDGARPLVTAALISKVYMAAEQYGAAIPTVAPVDSFRSIEQGTSRTIDRTRLRAVQTPQAFRTELIRQAYRALSAKQNFTDDASAVEAIGGRITLVDGERQNIKITCSVDMAIADALMKRNL